MAVVIITIILAGALVTLLLINSYVSTWQLGYDKGFQDGYDTAVKEDTIPLKPER